MSVILIFKNAEGDVIHHKPLKEKISVGRSTKADITIKDELLSGLHGHFERDKEGKIVYSDHHSKNGSYLNGVAIGSCHLKLKDQLKIGMVDVSIDEKSLSAQERNLIGYKKLRKLKDITLLKEFKKRQKREGTTKVFIRFRN